ncbi:putative lipoprotein YiaD precursor [compost metagenome]
MNFLDADNLDRTWFGPSNDKWSYGYAGLNFALGSKSKKNLDWVNPYALMYDELKDNELRQEVETLKSRVAATEGDVSNIKKDADGDGVSDVFDKEPNTPAGNVVDGAGRTIVFPKTVSKPKVEDKIAQWNADFKNILFDTGKATIRPESLSILEKAANEMAEYPQYKFYVDGYTDNVGNAKTNKTLSQKRAAAVAQALKNNGVEASRIKSRGFGSEKPKCSNKTTEGKQCNRRVEIKLQ